MYTDEFFADPHPTYAELREQAPVQRVKDPRGLEYWLITRYDEAKAALADRRLAKDPRHAWDALRAAGLVDGEPEEATFDLHTTDPPEHTRLRSLVGKAFTPGRIDALRPRIQQITDELIDGFAAAGAADLIDEFAYPLSLTVIAELIGVPIDDRDEFRAWTAAALTPPYLPGASVTREEGGRRLRQFVTELVAGKTPGEDDLLGALLAARDLEERQLIALTQQLLFAGHEPTTNLVGNGMVALLRSPDQLSRLEHHPELLPQAIDELLRYDGPTARSSPSYATEDIEIGGTVIPAGSVVIVGIASINRDPRRFLDPDRLDVTRSDQTHLAFGHGIHRCLGVPLARLEGEIAIGTLLRRLPGLSLAGLVTWLPHPVFRGVAALPVTWST